MKLISWIRVCPLVVAVACHEVNAPLPLPVPDDVAQFLASLPKLRSASAVVSVPDEAFLLFSATYGEPQDCPSGCFFAQVWGIKYAGQLGWIRGTGPAEPNPSAKRLYDVRSTDTYLFNESLWNRLADEWIGAEFRLMLACDLDTPSDALERLAVRLPTEGWPFLADVLVDIAQRRDVRSVAEIVATLGPSSFNYSGSRAHAKAALSNWPGQPSAGYCPL